MSTEPERPWVWTDVYERACAEYMGWCPSCRKFTRPMTEPDAMNYDCPACGLDCVVGAENGLIMMAFELVDRDN